MRAVGHLVFNTPPSDPVVTVSLEDASVDLSPGLCSVCSARRDRYAMQGVSSWQLMQVVLEALVCSYVLLTEM